MGTIAAAILEEIGTETVAAWARKLGVPDAWDPFAFVDLCATCEQTHDPALTEAAQRIQWAEMLLLLQSAWSDAGGRAANE